MRTTFASSAIILAWISDVSAFYAGAPAWYPSAKLNDHYGNIIAEAFGGLDQAPKLSLHKRAINKRAQSQEVMKLANDFEIVQSKTPSLPNSAAIDQDTTDYSYFSDITLGTSPGLTVKLLLDTGSSALWVMGDDCKSKACANHDSFGPSDSKTYKTGGGDFSINYATGSITGQVITDQVTFGSISLNMQFAVATQTTDEFAFYPIDGILGLARVPGPGPTQPTFLQVLTQSKLIQQNIFGINLARSSDNTNDGEINFGSIDTSKFSGDINWQNTVGALSLWQVPINGLMVDGQLTQLSGDRTAVIDSGTSYLYIPPADAKAIMDAIPGETTQYNGTYIIPCDTKNTISLVFNGVAYDLPPKDYVGVPINGGCTSHIFPVDAIGDNKTWLIGDTFMKNVYSVFDSDNSRVGFGAKGTTTTITSLVSSATPTVSAASNQILSGTPVVATSGNSIVANPGTSGSSSAGSSDTGTASSPSATSSTGTLPIGPGNVSGSSSSGTSTGTSGTGSGTGTGNAPAGTAAANTKTGAGGRLHFHFQLIATVIVVVCAVML